MIYTCDTKCCHFIFFGSAETRVCPDCGKKISVFGESHIDEIAASLETEVLGKMPIDPSLASLADGGKFSEQKDTHLDAAVEKLYKLYRENPKDDEE